MLDRTNDDDVEKQAARAATNELGSAGLKVFSGIIYEEYHKDLQGRKAVDVFRRMADSDPTIGACLLAFYLILRAVEWRTEPAKDSGPAGEAEAEFVDSIFEDMNVTWEDFLSEVLTMLIFGWHYAEIVLKKRVGPEENDPAKRSKYTDGRIGIRKIAPRPQDTLWRWEIQSDGGIDGMWQWVITEPREVYIPIERALLFRTSSNKNNPEGRSILRSAYRSWQKLTVIEDAEAVGIERELAGLPVAFIPAKCLKADATPGDLAFKNQITKLVRDVKYNEQAGVVLPSDPYRNDDGSLSAAPQVRFELLTSGGKRMIDTNTVVMRHQRSMARSVLADFLMLGQDKGAFNLGENKTDLFYRACEAVMAQIAAPINEYLLPRIWAYNGLDWALMPKRIPGRIAPIDLTQLSEYIAKRAGAGDTLFPDPELTKFLNEIADMPPPSEELLELGEKAIEEGTVGPGAEAKLAQQQADAKAKANGGQPEEPFPDDGEDPRKKPPFPFGKALHDAIDAVIGDLIAKGDLPGHAFRGNQHTGGIPDTIGYHGTKKVGFSEFKVPDPREEYMVDRAIGVHVAKDPAVAESFLRVHQDAWGQPKPEFEGGMYMLRIPSENQLYEVNQPLLPYITDQSTPKTGKNVYTDQVSIGNLVYKTAFEKDEGLFSRFLQRRWHLSPDQANEAASSILKGEPWSGSSLVVGHGRASIRGLDDYIKRDGVISVSDPEDRARAVDLFHQEFKQRGYKGIKYINTSPEETRHAKDFTSYIVFDPKDVRFKHAPSDTTVYKLYYDDDEFEKWDESKHPRGKTTESSNEGSFAPSGGASVGGTEAKDAEKPKAEEQEGGAKKPTKAGEEDVGLGEREAAFGGDDRPKLKNAKAIYDDMSVEGKVQQPTGDLDELYKLSRADEKEFQTEMARIAEATGGEMKYQVHKEGSPAAADSRTAGTNLKGYDRASEKVEKEYKGNVTELGDVMRGTMVHPTVQQSRMAAALMKETFGDRLVRMKDRFAKPMGGYRDILANVRTKNGVVAEMQFGTKNSLAFKDSRGHNIYQNLRTLPKGSRERQRLEQATVSLYERYYKMDGNGTWGVQAS